MILAMIIARRMETLRAQASRSRAAMVASQRRIERSRALIASSLRVLGDHGRHFEDERNPQVGTDQRVAMRADSAEQREIEQEVRRTLREQTRLGEQF